MMRMAKRKYATTIPKDEANNKEPERKRVSFNKKQYDSG